MSLQEYLNYNINISTSASIILTNCTIPNIVNTNSSISSLLSINNSFTNLTSTFNTFANNLTSLQTTGTLIVTTSASLIGTTNTIGSIFTTGGNVGINTTSPGFTLDVNGTGRFTNLTSTTNTIGNLSNTNLLSTNITTTNLVASTVTTGALLSTNINSTNVTTSNLLSTNLTISNLISTFNTFANTIASSQTTGTLTVTTNASLIGNTNTIGSIFTTGGNVGINTTSPGFTLDVNGTGRFTNLISTNMTATNLIASTVTTSSLLSTNINSTNITTTNVLATFISSGNIKVLANGNIITNNENGTTHPIHIYSTSGPNSASSASFYLGPDATNNISYIQTSKNGANLNLCLNPRGGNVGINTTSPGFTLDVAGSANISSSLTTSNVYSTNITSTNIVGTNITTNAFVANTVTTGSLLSTNINSTNVTISNLLSISNTVTNLVSTFNTFANNFTNLQTTGTLIVTTSASLIGNTNTIGSIFTTGGNVGINTTSPGFTLDVLGAARVSGSINMTSTNYGSTGGNVFANYLGYSYGSGIVCNGFTFSSPYFMTTQFVNSNDTVYLYTPGTVSNTVKMSILSNGNVGINTISPGFTLDVNGTGRFTNLISTNITTSSILATNVVLTSGSFGNISSSNISVSGNMTIGGNLLVAGTLIAVNTTSVNIIDNNITAGTLNAGSITSSNLFSTNNSLTNLISTNSTISSLNTTNLLSTNITTSAILSTNSTITNLVLTSGTFSNKVGGSQTVGTLVITTSASLIGNTNTIGNLFTTGGNVGVNTTSPSYTLDINGSLRVSSLYVNSTSIIAVGGTTTLSTAANTNQFVVGTSGHIVLLPNTTGLAIGAEYYIVNQSSQAITVGNNSNTALNILNPGSSEYFTLTSNTGAGGTWAYLGGNVINGTTGNVGINTTSPAFTLDVNGTTRVNSSQGIILSSNGGANTRMDFTYSNPSTYLGIAASARIQSVDNNYGADLLFQNRNQGTDNTTMNTRMTIAAGGNIGINTTTPGFNLDVNGSLKATSGLFDIGSANTNIALKAELRGSNITIFNPVAGSSAAVIQNSGSFITTICLNSGNVGINNTSPGFTLDVNGNIRTSTASGTNTFINTSSATSMPLSILTPNLASSGNYNFTYFGQSLSNNNSGQLNFQYFGNNNTTNNISLSFFGGATGIPFTISANGNIGLNNITIPIYPLHVSGNIYAGTSSFTSSGSGTLNTIGLYTKGVFNSGVNGFPAVSGTTGNAIALRVRGNDDAVIDFGINSGAGGWLQTTNYTGYSSNYPLLLNPNGGNIGINNTSPNTILDIQKNGSAVINLQNTGTGASQLQLFSHSDTNNYFQTTGDVLFTAIGQSTTRNLRLTTSGNVLIGATNTFSPVSLLTINAGNINTVTQASIAFSFAPAPGYYHFIGSRHNGTSGSNQNSIDFYLNNSSTQTGSSSPNFGNVNSMSVTATGVGIFNSSPIYSLDVTGQIRSNIPTPVVGNNDSIYIGQSLSNNNTAIIDYNYTTVGSSLNSLGLGFFGANNKLVVQAGGNVGINTGTPAFALDVNGTINSPNLITTTITSSNLYSGPGNPLFLNANTNAIYFAQGGTTMGFYNSLSFAPQTDASINLGTSSNRFNNLSIARSAFIGSSPGNNIFIGTSSTTTVGNGILQVAPNTSTGTTQDCITCRAQNNTNILISFYNTAGSIMGAINGTSATSVSYNTSSDIRLKNNIKPLPKIMDTINKINVVEFNWETCDTYDHGFIAQEIFKLFPHMRPDISSYTDCTCKNNHTIEDLCDKVDHENPLKSDGSNHTYGLDYGKMTPYLVKGLQEQQGQINSQQNQIDTLLNFIKSNFPNDKIN